MHSNLSSTSTCALTLNTCSEPLISVGLKDTLKSFAEQGMVMGLHIHSGLVCVLSASQHRQQIKSPTAQTIKVLKFCVQKYFP